MEAAAPADHEQGHRHGGVFTAEAGDRGDGPGGDPLDEPEDRGAGAGVVGDLGRGERATVGIR